MTYAIINRADWRDGRVQDDPRAEIVTAGQLHARISLLLGRNPLASYPSVAAKLRREGRVYLAAMPGAPVRGIVVESVYHPAIITQPPASTLDARTDQE